MLGDHFLVAVTVPDLEPRELFVRARELDLIVGNNFLVSAHKVPLPFRSQLLTRGRQDPNLVRLDSAFMLYIILDELLEYLEDQHEELQLQVEHMQQRALQNGSDDYLGELLRFKRYAFALSQVTDEHHTVFEAFLRADFPFVSRSEVHDYFDLLESRYSRLVDKFRAARQEVNGAFDIYVSHQAHRTNNVMKLLTMVSTVLLPTTVIVGFFGTSFTQPVALHTMRAFFVMVALILLVSAASLIAFRRSGWI